MTTPYDVLVIGAGQAGLAAGYHLQQTELSFAILEGTSEDVVLPHKLVPRATTGSRG